MTDNAEQAGQNASPGGERTPIGIGEDTRTREMSAKVGQALKSGVQLTGEGVKLVWHDPLLAVKTLDRTIDWARRVMPVEFFGVISRFLAWLGYVGLVVSAFCWLVFGITSGVKEESFSLALYGAGLALLMIVLQYTAHKLLAADDALVTSTPTVMESDAFLRCVALIGKIGAIIVIAAYTTTAIRQKEWGIFWTGLGTCLVCASLAFVAIHPALASTSISRTASPGEEAIGVISFFVKAFMRLVPIIFGIAVFAASVMLVIATVNLLRDKTDVSEGYVIGRMLITYSLLPFAAYIGFALFCLQVELLRAILSIRGIARKHGEQ